MQTPFHAQAMIHSLNSKRDVLILSNKLCSAVYNPFSSRKIAVMNEQFAIRLKQEITGGQNDKKTTR